MSDSSDSELDEGEFIVGAIINHRQAERLVAQTLEKKCRFIPGSIQENRLTHSKYGYLVHWKNYPKEERSWEPEEGLEHISKLRKYKKRNGLPPEHETYYKDYGAKMTRDLNLASDDMHQAGINWFLLTKEERSRPDPWKEAPKPVELSDKNTIKNRLQEMNDRKKKDKERLEKRERILTPTVAEDEYRKKKRQEKEERRRREEMNMTEEERAEAKRKRKEARKAEEGLAGSSDHNSYRIPKKDKGAEASSSSSAVAVRSKSIEEIPAKASSSFGSVFNNNGSMMVSRPTALPGIQRLNINTPRIQKKKTDSTPNSADISTPQCAQATFSIASPRPLIESSLPNVKQSDSVIILEDTPDNSPLFAKDGKRRLLTPSSGENTAKENPNPPLRLRQLLDDEEDLKLRLKSPLIDMEVDEDDPMDVDEPDLMVRVGRTRHRRWSEMEWPSSENEKMEVSDEEGLHAEDSEEDEEEREDALLLKKLRRESEILKMKKGEFLHKIPVDRVHRTFATPLRQQKMRRTRSCEQLPNFWNSYNELELFLKNVEGSYGMSRNEIPIVKQFPEEVLFDVQKPVPLTTEEIYQKKSVQLAQENWQRVDAALKRRKLKLGNEVVDWIKSLSEEYSRDDFCGFRARFKAKSVSNPSLDLLRFMVVVFITAYCQHPLWNQDPKGFSLVESDENETIGEIRCQQQICGEGHRKCLWMEMFLQLLPLKYRFLESSEKSFNGLTDDGPFRDDVFFHCMRMGAECQKDLFFKYNKPIGIQEDQVCEYMIDATHMLATQYGNSARLRWCIAAGGLDINALATHMPTKRVMTLYNWLSRWIKENVRADESDTKTAVYYHRVLKSIQTSASSLDHLVTKNVEELVENRMNRRWKALMDLTHPHIIRCSPANNECNGGEGTHQVLSCLFQPESIGLRDGLPGEPELHNEKASRKRIEALQGVVQRYRQLLGDRKARVILALYRISVKFREEAKHQTDVGLEYKLIDSDDGCKIEKMTLLRQKDNLEPEEADLDMYELTKLSSPGCRYYGIKSENVEREFLVPGNAHIEMTGEIDGPETFVAQLFLFKKTGD